MYGLCGRILKIAIGVVLMLSCRRSCCCMALQKLLLLHGVAECYCMACFDVDLDVSNRPLCFEQRETRVYHRPAHCRSILQILHHLLR